MILIGEKINSSFKSTRSAMESRDSKFIEELAQKQIEAGATFIDIHAGAFLEEEPLVLEWLVNAVQSVVSAPLSIDSTNPEAIKRALMANKTQKPIINAITDEKEKYDALLPLVLEYQTGVIALCMDDTGMPETVKERLEIAGSLVQKLTSEGVKLEDIYLDPMVRPVGTGSHYGVAAIETIRAIKKEFPQVRLACGISNISFGIPARNLMNQAFLVTAMAAGLDVAILDPLDNKLMALFYATQALMGKDEFCMEYLMKFREGLLDI